MTPLEKDMSELYDEVVTKRDIKAAFKIAGEVVGMVGAAYAAFCAITIWLPGLGVPLSGAAAAKLFQGLAQAYANLPTDQRKVVAKVCKWLTGFVN